MKSIWQKLLPGDVLLKHLKQIRFVEKNEFLKNMAASGGTSVPIYKPQHVISYNEVF